MRAEPGAGSGDQDLETILYAVADAAVKAIVLRGAGRSFGAGYDFAGLPPTPGGGGRCVGRCPRSAE